MHASHMRTQFATAVMPVHPFGNSTADAGQKHVEACAQESDY